MIPPDSPSWRTGAAMVFLWLAAGLALFLALQSIGSLPLPGCGEGDSCQTVLDSRFGYILGMPAPWLGFVTYSLLILTSGAWVRREATAAATLGALLAGAAIGAALWFVAIQALLLKQWCPWCLTTHISVLTALVLLLAERRRLSLGADTVECRTESNSHAWMLTSLLASTALLALAAWLGKAPAAAATIVSRPALPEIEALNATNGAEVWHLSLGERSLPLDISGLPILGSPGAGRTAVLVTDYTCDHCRDYHTGLDAVLKDLQPDLRLLLLPAYRDDNGQAVQRCMLTLYHTDRTAWQALHGRLLDGSLAPIPALVAEAASKAIGQTEWSAAVRTHQEKVTPALEAARNVQLHNRTAYPDAAVLPQLMAGSSVLMGAEKDRGIISRFLTENTSPLAAKSPPAPVRTSGLTLQNDNINLGEVLAGTTVRVSLQAMNRTLEPLTLGRAELDMGLLIVSMPGPVVGGGSRLECTLDCSVPDTAGPFERTITFHAKGQPLRARFHGIARQKTASLAGVNPSLNP